MDICGLKKNAGISPYVAIEGDIVFPIYGRVDDTRDVSFRIVLGQG